LQSEDVITSVKYVSEEPTSPVKSHSSLQSSGSSQSSANKRTTRRGTLQGNVQIDISAGGRTTTAAG
jgi:hypothetical protein